MYNFEIDQLKHRISQLEAEISLYKQIIGSAPVSIFAKDLHKKHILSNEFNNMNLNLYETEVVGKTNDEIFPTEIAEKINQIDDRILAGESSVVQEETLDTIEGKKYFLATRVPFFDEYNKIAGIFGISQDITELKNYQLKVEDERRSEILNNILMGLSHDLNNYISLIINNAELLRFEENTIKVTETVEEIIRASTLATQVIKDLKNYKISGSFQRNRELHINFNTMINEIFRLTLLKEYHQISLNKEIRTENVKLVIDQRHLIQIIMNLILNSIEAMQGKGTIDLIIDTKEIDPHWKLLNENIIDRRYLKIEIKDNGPGMSENVRNNIFNPYFTTKTGNNSGLGLYITKSIITEYGGYILVESAEHKGTSFLILLPIKD